MRPGTRQAGGVKARTAAAPALTRREKAIASLVTAGLTNRQIADRLFISSRTVESHVQHILNKLGATSRTSIAVWTVEQRLTGAAGGNEKSVVARMPSPPTRPRLPLVSMTAIQHLRTEAT